MIEERLFRYGGLVVWLMVGVPLLLDHAGATGRVTGWAVAYLALGLTLFAHDRLAPRERVSARFLEVACVATIVLLLCNGFEGALLVLIAMQLARDERSRTALLWIVLQTLLVFAAIAFHWTPRAALMLMPPYLGFQLLAFFLVQRVGSERAAREELARNNAELRAMTHLLADSSRMAERLRIARDLHDSAGHHLGALSLHLEAALQRSDLPARESIATARGLASSLLADIRAMVAETASREGIDLEEALRALVIDVPRPRLHLSVGEGLRVDDPERAHVVVRCAQEIVTNAAKHSKGENLWISVAESEDGVLRLDARDDGAGSESLIEGFGLRGMRSRVEGLGGELRIVTSTGRGFGLTALVPQAGSRS
jgi:signal transduction histidine kinase